MTVVSSDRPQPGIAALIEAAPPAALVQWGTLILVFFTAPIQPYTAGAWGIATLAALGGLGMLAGVVGRGATGVAGVIAGFAAAVAIQLYVLGGQALGSIGTLASLTEPPWSERVATALAIGLTAVIGGYVLVAGARGLIGRRGTSTPQQGRSGRMLAAAGVLTAAAIVVGVGVTGVASSAYVVPSDLPVVDLEVDGDEIVSAAPTGVLVGRMELDVRRTRDGLGEVSMTSALTPDERAALESDRVHYFKFGLTLLGSTGDSDERRHIQLEAPGIYAFVVWDPFKEPDAAGFVTVLDAVAFEVLPPAAAVSTAPADGGVFVDAGAAIGVLVGGWSAAGSVLKARRRRWIDDGRPRSRDLVVATVVGFAAALLLGALALIAIDLARNPF